MRVGHATTILMPCQDQVHLMWHMTASPIGSESMEIHARSTGHLR